MNFYLSPHFQQTDNDEEGDDGNLYIRKINVCIRIAI